MTEEKMGIDVEKIVDQSTKLRKDEDYEGARRIDQEGYDRCVLEYGEKDPNTLRVLHFLAIDYERLGDLEKAVELYQKIYDAKRTTIGSEHKETLNVLVALSSLYSKLKQHEKAVETDEKIYEIRKRNLGPEHLDTLSALNNVAYDYRQLGQFENAKELDRRVYMKRKQLLGEEDSKTLSSAKHLAYDYGMLGDFENAIKVQEELCRILKEKLEPDNPLLLDSLTNLSTFYYETQKHEQARHVDEEIYHTQKLVLPENDENLVLTQENLAYDYHQLNDYEQAQTMDLSLLELKKASLGEEHEETILKMEHLAEDYYQLGNYEEAFKLDQVLFEKYPIIKEEDKTFIRIVNRLVVECEKLNQLELAQPYILKQLEFANDNEEVRVELLKNALQKFKIAKDYENAVKANQELVEYMKSIYGAFSKEAVEERYAYIQLLQEASLLSDLAREYEILYDLFDRNRGSDHEDTLLLQEDLARAYIHAGMMQPAEATLRNLYARRLRLTGENDEKTILIKKVLDKLIGEPPVEEAVVEEARVEEAPVEETQAEKDSDFLEKVKQYYQTCLEESGPNHKQTLRAQAFYACVLDDEKETPELLKDVYQKKGKFIFHIGHFDQEELDKKKEAQALWKVKNTTQALEAYRELKQMNQHLPSLHPDAVYTDLWYAQALRQEGKKEEQMELLKSIYERAKEVKLEKHDDVLPVLDALANEAYEKKEYNEAIHMHRELYSRWLHKKDANDLQTIYYEHLLAKDYAEASFGFRNAELYAKDAYERLKRIAGKESEITTLVGLTLVEIYQKYNEKKNAERILSEVSEIFNETNIENSILLERYHNLQEKVAQMEDALNADEPMMETPVEEKVVLNSIVEPITPFEQDEPALDETLIMPSLNTVPQKLPEIEDLPVEPVVENHPEETLVPVVDDLPFEQEEEPKVEPIIEDLTDEMEAVKEPEISSVIEESKVEPIIEDLTDEIEVVKEPEIKPVVEELFTDIPKIPETPVPPIIENSFTEIPGLDGPIIKNESIEEVIHPDSPTQSQAVSQEEDTDQFFYDPKFEEAKKYFVSGNYMEAEKAFEDLSKSYETIYGKEDIRTLDATYLYGLTLSHVGKLLESKTAFEKVFESRRRVLGDTHDDTIHAERELSKICQRTGFNTMASMLAQDIFDKLNKK